MFLSFLKMEWVTTERQLFIIKKILKLLIAVF